MPGGHVLAKKPAAASPTRAAKRPRAADADGADAATAALAAEPADAAETVASPAEPAQPFLVLHFDVNKTIVMSDACQGYSVAKVLGEILGRATYGTDQGESGWAWDGQRPSSSAPKASGSVSYMAWLRKQGLGSDELLRRLAALGQRGSPPADVAAERERMEAALRLPEGEVGDSYRAVFDQGSFPATQPWRYVVDPFFRVVQTLARRGRRFAIVIRTFGTDIGNGLCDEINAFAEGRHPLYPDAGRFDGTNGRPDLRITLDDPLSHGSFYRDKNGAHLVLGTLERPPPHNDVSEVGLCHYDGRGLKVVDGHPAIAAEIAQLVSQRGIIALQDYWPWWGKVQNERADAGKPIYVDLEDFSTHSIFFDDHVARADAEDAHIVDARDPTGSPLPFSAVVGSHVIRSEPFDCLSDPDYFINCVDSAERQRQALSR
mmetsp:Transcript_24026/g.56774  ORF Transcript_24026/g.56774 Transcript_24026/m.56774 type:complete len:433 (+) Transcript_24026:67-1365(+)